LTKQLRTISCTKQIKKYKNTSTTTKNTLHDGDVLVILKHYLLVLPRKGHDAGRKQVLQYYNL
jgi:hypothetical protein